MPARKIFCTVASRTPGHDSEAYCGQDLSPTDSIDRGQTMRAIFGAVTFPQQRSWAISLAAPNHARSVIVAVVSDASPVRRARPGVGLPGVQEDCLSLRPSQIKRAMSPTSALSDASRAV